MDAFHQRQIHQLELDAERRHVLRQQMEYDRRRPRAALYASVSALAAPDTHPNSANRRATAERRKTRDGEEQDKGVASYVAPLVHFCPQCGQFTGDGSGVKSREKTTN